MKIYISGRITGINHKIAEGMFEQAEKFLSDQGHTPINPMRIKHDHGKSWEEYMLEDIRALFGCEAIFMLCNWGQSRGARIEYQIAREMGLRVMFQEYPGPVTMQQ